MRAVPKLDLAGEIFASANESAPASPRFFGTPRSPTVVSHNLAGAPYRINKNPMSGSAVIKQYSQLETSTSERQHSPGRRPQPESLYETSNAKPTNLITAGPVGPGSVLGTSISARSNERAAEENAQEITYAFAPALRSSGAATFRRPQSDKTWHRRPISARTGSALQDLKALSFESNLGLHIRALPVQHLTISHQLCTRRNSQTSRPSRLRVPQTRTPLSSHQLEQSARRRCQSSRPGSVVSLSTNGAGSCDLNNISRRIILFDGPSPHVSATGFPNRSGKIPNTNEKPEGRPQTARSPRTRPEYPVELHTDRPSTARDRPSTARDSLSSGNRSPRQRPEWRRNLSSARREHSPLENMRYDENVKYLAVYRLDPSIPRENSPYRQFPSQNTIIASLELVSPYSAGNGNRRNSKDNSGDEGADGGRAPNSTGIEKDNLSSELSVWKSAGGE